MNNTRPARIVALRPIRSEIGPAKKVPRPMPKTKAEITNPARSGSLGEKAAAMAGIAGSMASIANAIREDNKAVSATNSTKPGIFMCIV